MPLTPPPVAPTVPLTDAAAVARVLQVTEASLPDATTWYIEVASSWARRFLRQPNLGVAGSATQSFFDQRSDAYIPLEGVPTEVKVRRAMGGPLEPLTAGTEWDFEGDGVRLHPPAVLAQEEYDPRYYAEPYGQYQRIYQEVQVTMTLSEEVDPLVVEGVAQAAAAIISRSPREAKGLFSESIGDYSYSSGFGQRGLENVMETSPFFSTAKAFLRMVPRSRGVPFVP